MIRVLVVDDSAAMRALIRQALASDPDLIVVGEAADPLEARTAIKALDPDVVTLDVEMPNMSGLEFLEKLMRLRPTRVVMVSTLTHAGAQACVDALALGAIECVGKPTAAGGFEALAAVVKTAAAARLRPAGEVRVPAPRVPAGRDDYRPADKVVAIGASTGGVEALCEILSLFPVRCPPTLITQHMPATFTASFAARLDRLCAPTIEEARDGAPLEPGRVYLAPGGVAHLTLAGKGRQRCRLSESGPVNGHRPSVDVMFESVAAHAGRAGIGVILTGMGRDGAKGLLSMREAGAVTFGQDEASSIVYGMPKAAADINAVCRQLPLHRLAEAILHAARVTEPAH